MAYSEDDARHAFTKKNDEAIYAFFQQYLELPGDPSENDVEVPTPEELQVTPTGQISTSLDGRFVFDINKEETEALLDSLEQSRKDVEDHLRNVRRKAMELSGYVAPSAEPDPFFVGRFQRDGYSVAMCAIRGEGDYVVPMLVCVPDGRGTSPARSSRPRGGSSDGSVPAAGSECRRSRSRGRRRERKSR